MKRKKAVMLTSVSTLVIILFASCASGKQKNHFSQNAKGNHLKNHNQYRPAEKLDENICFFKVRK